MLNIVRGTYIERDISDAMMRTHRHFPVALVTGLRQSPRCRGGCQLGDDIRMAGNSESLLYRIRAEALFCQYRQPVDQKAENVFLRYRSDVLSSWHPGSRPAGFLSIARSDILESVHGCKPRG